MTAKGSALLLLVLSSVLLTFSCGAEKEPNDSFYAPEVLTSHAEGGFNTHDDVDIYRVDVQGRNRLDVTLVKTDGTKGTISLETYSSERERMYYPGIDLTVYLSGESETDSWTNLENTPTHIYLKLEGSGNYSLDVKTVYVPPVQDAHSSRETAMEVDEGTYAGNVTSGGLFEEGDTDYFHTLVPPGMELVVTLELVKARPGSFLSMITLEGESADNEPFSMLLMLSDEGEVQKGTWFNEDPNSHVGFYLIISGDGDYSLEVSLEDPLEDDVERTFDVICYGSLITCGLGIVIATSVLVTLIVVSMMKKKRRNDSS
ncbi:MAG: hypothetical protein MUC62_04875 [Candidatus Thermoplasmatota archaeon]|nr:hypothetical protein [Candidatus Thermoplasmatota archaeon]